MSILTKGERAILVDQMHGRRPDLPPIEARRTVQAYEDTVVDVERQLASVRDVWEARWQAADQRGNRLEELLGELPDQLAVLTQTLEWIGDLYSSHKTTGQCASDAYEMSTTARAALTPDLVARAADYQDAVQVRKRVRDAITALDAAGDEWTGTEIVARAHLQALLGGTP